MSIKIVQFLHSGQEYKRSEFIKTREKTIKPWNTGDHKRKFLHAKGAYIKGGKETKENDIYFWGEWEPDSEVTKIQTKVKGHCPQYIHKPFLRLNESEQHIKGDKNSTPTNTDPFVFGDKGFFYSCCMQSRYKKLQQLEPGSIILFGSNINHNKDNAYFALDTVFVVGDDKNKKNQYKLKYKINSDLKDLHDFAPDYYCDIMNFKGWKDSLNSPCNSNEKNDRKGSDCTSIKSKSEGCENGSDFTCYRGASYDNPITCENDSTKKMYSFVPCKIGSKGENGFERVKLTMDSFQKIRGKEIISNNLNQGVKYTEVTLKESFAIWNKLREIIHEDKEQGFKEAVRLDYK
ncbi:hypothetical protein [Segatella paludivivens]|uniref:hypothetical protein n=1 Tax=Segatella paludivivens TaxID=185294 RepID=UPI0003668128|nr:hypothetical protein [Segatella paludivivens]